MTLKTHHHNFAFFLQTVHVNAIEKLIATLNVQPKIGTNQSLIRVYHYATLLVTSHGSILHPVLLCKVQLMLFVISIYTEACMIAMPVMHLIISY